MRRRPILHGWIAPAVAAFFALSMVIALVRGPNLATASTSATAASNVAP